MRRTLSLGIVLTFSLLGSSVFADYIPSTTISATPDGANFDYTIVLSNASTATQSLGTFWYAWIPGKDFLPTNPIAGDFTTPSGWKLTVTHVPNVPTNGYALQWVALTTASELASGSSLTFGFVSADTPSQIAGDSPFYPGTPVNTSFAYLHAPFSDGGVQFQVRSVPEPASLALFGLGGIGMIFAHRRMKAKRAKVLIPVA